MDRESIAVRWWNRTRPHRAAIGRLLRHPLLNLRVRPLIHAIRHPPLWLSTLVADADLPSAVHDQRRNRSRTERVREFVYDWSDQSHAIAAFFTGLVGIVAAAWLVGSAPTDADSGASSDVLTIGAATGTIFGLVLAAVIFAMQFHTQRLGPLHFLTKYLVRYEGIGLFASVGLAITGTHLLIGLPLDCPARERAVMGLARIDLMVIPTGLCWALWLVVRMVFSVAGDFFSEYVRPAIRADLRRLVAARIRQHIAFNRLKETCADDFGDFVGINYLFSLHHDGGIPLATPRRGLVVDVDLHALGRIASLLSSDAAHSRMMIGMSPTAMFWPEPTCGLVWRKTMAIRQATGDSSGEIVIPRGLQEQLESVLRRGIVVAPRPTDDLGDEIIRILRGLSAALHEQWGATLWRPLQLIRDMADTILSQDASLDLVGECKAVFPGIMYSSEPPFTDGYSELIRVSADVPSDGAWRDLANHFVGLIHMGVTYGNVDVIEKTGSRLTWLIRERLKNQPTEANLFNQVDAMLGRVVQGLAFFTWSGDEEGTLLVAKQQQVTREVVEWAVGFIRLLVDDGHLALAGMCLERLQKPHTRFRHQFHRPQGPGEAADHLAFGELALAAWALWRAIDDGLEPARAQPFIGAVVAAKHLEDRKEILRLWERFPWNSGGDQPFKWDQWHLWKTHDGRMNWPRSGIGVHGWLEDGLVVLMIAAAHDTKNGYRNRRLPATPASESWVPAQVDRRVVAIIERAEQYAGLVGLDKEEFEKRAGQVAQLLKERYRTWEESQSRNATADSDDGAEWRGESDG